MIVVHKDTDITEYVSSMSWGGSKSEVARKLELHIVNAPLDKNITPLTINLADPVYLFEDDGKTELFRGFVVEREASSTTGTVTYTCYDLLFYTIKSNATYNFSSKTAEAITQMVCDDMEIPVGSLAQTGLTQKLIVQNVSIYEIIMRAYTQAYQQNGVSYRVVAKKGYRFFGEYTLLRKSTCKTFKRRMLSISSKRENNVSPTYSEWCSFNSYVGWLQHCDSFRLYQKYVEPNVEYMHNYYLKEVKGNAEICKRKNYSGERKAS